MARKIRAVSSRDVPTRIWVLACFNPSNLIFAVTYFAKSCQKPERYDGMADNYKNDWQLHRRCGRQRVYGLARSPSCTAGTQRASCSPLLVAIPHLHFPPDILSVRIGDLLRPRNEIVDRAKYQFSDLQPITIHFGGKFRGAPSKTGVITAWRSSGCAQMTSCFPRST